MKRNKLKTRLRFHKFFTAEVTNLGFINVVADTFGECAWKVQQHINCLETKESHDIINIRRNIHDILF